MNRSGWKQETLAILILLLTLGLPGCGEKRETIFDRVVSIPQQRILDVPYLTSWCDRIVGLKKGFVDIKNGRLYYEEEGRGIPLVLVSGGPGVTHQAFHPYFSRIKNDARIIYYDQRGVGRSSIDSTGKTYTIKQAVEDLDALRKLLDIDTWAVLGWSYGGLVAQCYALTYPEHVSALILGATVDGLTKVKKRKPGRQDMFLSPTEQTAISQINAKANAGRIDLKQAAYHNSLAGAWKKYFYYKPTSGELIRIARYGWSPAPGFNELLGHQMYQISLDGKFDDFQIPTLIMEAKWDLCFGADKADLVRKNHPHAQFAYFEKSGHIIFADESEKFFSVLKEFLKTAAKAHATYKFDNKIQWPAPPSELAIKLAFAESVNKKMNKKSWGIKVNKHWISERLKTPFTWAS